jgi:hypothetical protein
MQEDCARIRRADAYADPVLGAPFGVYVVISYACMAMGLWALIDAATRRADAFPAADRQTKPIWLGILAGGLACQWIFPALFGPIALLGLAGIVAAIVYLVDVRRRVIEVSRGSRW